MIIKTTITAETLRMLILWLAIFQKTNGNTVLQKRMHQYMKRSIISMLIAFIIN